MNVEFARHGADDALLTDVGNSVRFADRWGHKLRYVRLWNSWLYWDGKRWARDERGQAVRWAVETVKNLHAEALLLDDFTERKQTAQWALRSEAKPRIDAMIGLGQSHSGIAAAVSDFDANPWKLNLANGTFDLRAGDFREPNDPADLITKLAPVAFDATATAPLWAAFLNDIFARDAELISYFQRAIGYALTGDISEQVMFFLLGIGANGKSTALEVIRRMMGDYATHTPTETLMRRRSGGIPNDIARLQGARFVSASEAEAGKPLAEELVKQLTGGDTVTARYLHREFFEFKPEAKIFLAANHKPRIGGGDFAIWRRVHLIPFDVVIPHEKQDRHLVEKLCEELPGILRWAIDGCFDWQERGLAAPARVLDATAQYREEMDDLAGFLTDSCEVSPRAFVAAKDLYAAYQQWCERASEQPMTQTEFGRELTARGYGKDRKGIANSTRRKGIRLKGDEHGLHSCNPGIELTPMNDVFGGKAETLCQTVSDCVEGEAA